VITTGTTADRPNLWSARNLPDSKVTGAQPLSFRRRQFPSQFNCL